MMSFIFIVLCQISYSVNLQGVIDEFSGNSNSFFLSEEVYDGVNIELKSSPMSFVGHTQSVLIQPEAASRCLFAVLSDSHRLENATLSMNKADSFVTISSDSSFDFVKCVWMDNVVASPIAIVAGGTVGFTNFDMESTTVEVPLVDCSTEGSSVRVKASSFRNVQATSLTPMLCSTQTRTVEISSSSFKDISYLPVLGNEEAEDEAPAKQINEILSVTIKSSNFKNCEAALELCVVPALSALSVKIASSSFDGCGLMQAVPEYEAKKGQHIQIVSSSFKNQHVDLEGKAGFVTFDSEEGVLEISACSFHSFSSSSRSGVIVFKNGATLQITWSRFSEVQSVGSSSSAISVETMPQTLVLNNTWFSKCWSSGRAGALVFGLPIDTDHPSSADSNTIASTSLYDNWFVENSGSSASDIFVDETALSHFDEASFEEMSSYSQSPHVLDASGTSYELPLNFTRLLKPHKWWILGSVVGFVWLVLGVVACCCGCCCCACCTCCCGAWCCRKTKKCCGAGRVCCEDDSIQQSEAQPAEHIEYVQDTVQPAQHVYALPPNHPTQMPLVCQPSEVVPIPVGVHVAVPATAPQFNACPTLVSKDS